jgi:hypothetical protein
MVKSDAAFHPSMLVQDIGIQAGVHAFAWATGGETATATKEGLENSNSVYIGGCYRRRLEGEVNVSKGRVGRVLGWLRGESEIATGIMRRQRKVGLLKGQGV